jgi:energy-coupling factor transport system substrate-specific component
MGVGHRFTMALNSVRTFPRQPSIPFLETSHMSSPLLSVIALCASLNLALGGVVFLVKLPVYLDMVGTILCALLLAPTPGRAFLAAATAGVSSFFIGGVFNPYLPFFSLTVVAVAALTAFVTGRSEHALRTASPKSLRLAVRVLGFGVLTGLLAALISAPTVVYLFGGVTGSGSALLIAFFLKAGNQLMNAAILSGLTAEPVDKTLQLVLAVVLLRATPLSVINRIRGHEGTGRKVGSVEQKPKNSEV